MNLDPEDHLELAERFLNEGKELVNKAKLDNESVKERPPYIEEIVKTAEQLINKDHH